ncbi:hypothetical protein ILUMI_19609 [Ignelater luminosus]|uniref:PiggyBac transposable element-derived protein domain-containing protein n=1 Tax=Ignelater luminosus TaxID=2038154 RepID=A0A8K0CHV4_IGNLU|nr:hypothetical protein ILUMI_19609 [Ignelater luminosus]
MLYACRDKGNHNFTLLEIEVRQFLGLPLIENDYWSTARDLCAPSCGSTMSKERFRTITRYLRLTDLNLPKSKVAKPPQRKNICEEHTNWDWVQAVDVMCHKWLSLQFGNLLWQSREPTDPLGCQLLQIPLTMWCFLTIF